MRQEIAKAFNVCEWTAVFKICALSQAIGINGIGSKASLLCAVCAVDNVRPSSQALQWLWELASGWQSPWNRGIISEGVSPHVSTMGSGISTSDAIRSTAVFLLFATDCVSLSASCFSTVHSFEIAVAIENAVSQVTPQPTAEHEKRLGILILWFLARWQRSFGECLDKLSGEPQVGWHGFGVKWTRGVPDRAVARAGIIQHDPQNGFWDVAVLNFPRLSLDHRRGWLHSDGGSQRIVSSSESSHQLAQFDARYSSESRCYHGHWLGGAAPSQPLPLRVYTLNSRVCSLKAFIAPSYATYSSDVKRGYVDAFSETAEPIQRPAFPKDGITVELFGVAGGIKCHSFHCFHVRKGSQPGASRH